MSEEQVAEIQGPQLTHEQLAERIRRLRESEAEKQRAVDAEDANATMRAAQKATGLSEEEIRAQWKDIKTPPVILDPRCDPKVQARSRMREAGCQELHIDHIGRNEPEGTPALEQVQQFLNSGLRMLVLSGGIGIGKTAAATWAIGQQGGVFFKASNLLDLAFAEDKTRWRELCAAKFVVCDDLGTEKQNEHWIEKFNGLIDDLYGNKASVIFTCNLNLEDFQKRYGEGSAGKRMLSRMRESGAFAEIEGEDRRGNP